ncbi:universal stress protein [Halomicroarcula sp. GCM10025817]|uniref:universal stress protein n=1 Tax=Haloarcula TaxID=2237 RepID=UPI0023E8669A|nr:universal stress protein [Halomicroarcula sp. SYNS111]
MTVLIPVRYPLTDRNKRAIEKGLELVADESDPELLIVYVNRLYKDDRIPRSTLRETVEAEFGTIPAHYVVRDGFLYEEAVLDEAIRQQVDHIVLSERRRAAWQQLLREAFDFEVDLESFLSKQLDVEIHVIPDEQ